MSMIDSFFSKGFKAAKCKTLLKLTIPRIKLLRNRRELQIKQMRRDIAKLLETGQEATARIRVEHIIREENMMAAQEILELFCELIVVRLPIIETQRECPLDLKEAISSVCFAAPRCADLPELLQVQMLFASKYGKEFVAAATELRPDCGVNRQLIEALSVRAPSAEKRLKLLKEIAEEHELDWNPEASETELFKSHEDLLDGPTQVASGLKLSLPEEKNDEKLEPAIAQASSEKTDSDGDFDILEFPEVPKGSLRQNASGPHSDIAHDTSKLPGGPENPLQMHPLEPEQFMHERLMSQKEEVTDIPTGSAGDKQFVPFITPPSPSSVSSPVEKVASPPPPRTKSEANVDLQDVLAAAQAAAETAERAAAAARSAASLAQVRISELANKKNEQFLEDSCDNPFHGETSEQSSSIKKPHSANQASSVNSDNVLKAKGPHQYPQGTGVANAPPLESQRAENDALLFDGNVREHKPIQTQPQRLSSMEDDPYLSYPNLFASQNSNMGSTVHPSTDNDRSSHGS